MRMLSQPIRIRAPRRVAVPPKQADDDLQTKAHRDWARAVIARAGGRCEAVEDGVRCPKAAPAHRMFADHIVERRDGGAPYDLANGRCLCGSHHVRKTHEARRRRLAG